MQKRPRGAGFLRPTDAHAGSGCVATFVGHSGAISSVAFSPDGSCLQTSIAIIVLSDLSPTNSASLPTPPEQPLVRVYGVSTDRAWNTYHGRNLL